MSTVRVYDYMMCKPGQSFRALLADYVQCPGNELNIKIMNVQHQGNGYDCGVFAKAFATTLLNGESPTQLMYHQTLSKHFLNCIESGCITPFPSSATYRQPEVVDVVQEQLYCKCRGIDNGKLIMECEECRQWFHGKCVGISTPKLASKWRCNTCQPSTV